MRQDVQNYFIFLFPAVMTGEKEKMSILVFNFLKEKLDYSVTDKLKTLRCAIWVKLWLTASCKMNKMNCNNIIMCWWITSVYSYMSNIYKAIEWSRFPRLGPLQLDHHVTTFHKIMGYNVQNASKGERVSKISNWPTLRPLALKNEILWRFEFV